MMSGRIARMFLYSDDLVVAILLAGGSGCVA